MNRRSVSPPAEGAPSFDAKLRANPKLAQSYIETTQAIYEEQVRTGKLAPAQAKEAKVLLRQFHGEMAGFIVQQELVKVAKRMLKLKTKRRLHVKDMEFLLQLGKETLPELKRRLKQVLKEQRAVFQDFLHRVEFEMALFSERYLAQGIGKAEAKELLAQSGMPLPSEMEKQSKRQRVMRGRQPPLTKQRARLPRGRSSGAV